MPPRSPLPQRDGLDAAWVRTSDSNPLNPSPWLTMYEWLHLKLGEFIDVEEYLISKRFVYGDGKVVLGADPYRDNTFVWYHRDLIYEEPVPGALDIVHQNERFIVVDKPPFLSTIPRGKHIVESVVIRMRRQLGLPQLTPAHRLDRITSGLLLLTTEKKYRGPYQVLFQQQSVKKTYLAMAKTLPAEMFPAEVENHLRKVPGEPRVTLHPDAAPNARSTIMIAQNLGEKSIYRLTPHTGKTHQLRQHMMTLGAPIAGDPVYPDLHLVPIDDFSTPLQLLASELEFLDPVTGEQQHFKSSRTFPVQTET